MWIDVVFKQITNFMDTFAISCFKTKFLNCNIFNLVIKNTVIVLVLFAISIFYYVSKIIFIFYFWHQLTKSYRLRRMDGIRYSYRVRQTLDYNISFVSLFNQIDTKPSDTIILN